MGAWTTSCGLTLRRGRVEAAIPVALDVLAIEELQKQRRAASSPEPKVDRTVYENAALLELGVANPRRITTERLSLPRPGQP